MREVNYFIIFSSTFLDKEVIYTVCFNYSL